MLGKQRRAKANCAATVGTATKIPCYHPIGGVIRPLVTPLLVTPGPHGPKRKHGVTLPTITNGLLLPPTEARTL